MFSVYVKSCEQDNLIEIGCIAILLEATLVTKLNRYLIISFNMNILMTQGNYNLKKFRHIKEIRDNRKQKQGFLKNMIIYLIINKSID